MSRFIAYKCLRCGRYSGMSLNNLYREDMTNLQQIRAIQKLYCSCKYCSKRVKFKKENDYMTRMVYKWFSHPTDMKKFIAEKNNEAWNPTLDDFR